MFGDDFTIQIRLRIVARDRNFGTIRFVGKLLRIGLSTFKLNLPKEWLSVFADSPRRFVLRFRNLLKHFRVLKVVVRFANVKAEVASLRHQVSNRLHAFG